MNTLLRRPTVEPVLSVTSLQMSIESPRVEISIKDHMPWCRSQVRIALRYQRPIYVDI